MAQVKLDPARLVQDGDHIYGIAQSLDGAIATLTSQLAGLGGMAGDDDSAEEFCQGADGYDAVAGPTIDAVRSIGNGLRLLDSALSNTARAYDGAQKPGAGLDAATAVPAESTPRIDQSKSRPPSALGPGWPGPLGEFQEFLEWGLHQVGVVIPTGDEGKLERAAEAWGTFSDSVRSTKSQVSASLTNVSAVVLPQAATMLSCRNELAMSLDRLSESAGSMQGWISDFLTQLRKTREELGWFLRQMAIELAADLAIGGLLSIVTAGIGALATAAKATSTVINWCIKIAQLIMKLKTFLQGLRGVAGVLVRGALHMAKEGVQAGLASSISTKVVNTARTSEKGYTPQDVGVAFVSAFVGGSLAAPVTRIAGVRKLQSIPGLAREAAAEGIGGAIDGLSSALVESGLTGQSKLNPLSSMAFGALLGGGLSVVGHGVKAVLPAGHGTSGAGSHVGSSHVDPSVDAPMPGSAGSGSGAGHSGSSVQVDSSHVPAVGAAASGGASAGAHGGVHVAIDAPSAGSVSHGADAPVHAGNVEVSSHGAPDVSSHAGLDVSAHAGADVSSHGGLESASHAAADVSSHGVPDVSSHGVPDVSSHGVPDVSTHGGLESASHAAPEVASHAAADVSSHSTPDVSAHTMPDVSPHGQDASHPSVSAHAAPAPDAPAAHAAPSPDAPAAHAAPSPDAPAAHAAPFAPDAPPAPAAAHASEPSPHAVPDADVRAPEASGHGASSDEVAGPAASAPDSGSPDASSPHETKVDGVIAPEHVAAAGGAAAAAAGVGALVKPAGIFGLFGGAASHAPSTPAAPGHGPNGGHGSTAGGAHGSAPHGAPGHDPAAHGPADGSTPGGHGSDSATHVVDSHSLDSHALDSQAADSQPADPHGSDVPQHPTSDRSLSEIDEALGQINPNFDTSDPANGYATNCGNTSANLFDFLNGRPSAEAHTGTLEIPEMEARTGLPQTALTPAQIESTLRAQGAGSHVVVGIDRSAGDGHWFNAYFDGHTVWSLDAQTGTRTPWPPHEPTATTWDVSIRPEHVVNPDGSKPFAPSVDAGTHADATPTLDADAPQKAGAVRAATVSHADAPAHDAEVGPASHPADGRDAQVAAGDSPHTGQALAGQAHTGPAEPRVVDLLDGDGTVIGTHDVWASHDQIVAMGPDVTSVVEQAAAKEGLSLVEVHTMIYDTPVKKLTVEQAEKLIRIREVIQPIHDGETMQKVLPGDLETSMFDPANGRRDSVSGFVARAVDTQKLTAAVDYLHGIGLDYVQADMKQHSFMHADGSAKSMLAIRFEKTPDVSPKIPMRDLGDQAGLIGQKYQPGGMGAPGVAGNPYLGNGFVGKGAKAIIPEYHLERPVMHAFADGSEMWRIELNGSETLVGVFRKGVWLRVG